jgi:predicted dehydrogenase/threonine dehydrogenase-like Zn-dependent dehydrogenase
MQAILMDMKTGQLALQEAPVPELRAGGILVATAFSSISVGTELSLIETGKKSLIGKAMGRPDLVRQVLDYARKNGLTAAYQKTKARLENLTPLGYSCSGTVLAVGDDATEFRVGDRVACAGAGYASHSEINFVPRNLAVKIPDGVSLEGASVATIGAIAMQGVRQAQLSVGETVVVVGAGLVGILTIQIARAAGCRVIAIDKNAERAAQAVTLGAHFAFSASEPDLAERVRECSRYGADAAVVTASSESSDPVELAATVLRDRGRIVVVGTVGLGVSRAVMFQKELSLTLSRSYGPGRYDPQYEELGQDYPIGYVRWTERRNMEAFLDLIANQSIRIEGLIANRRAFQDGPRAYEELKNSRAYTVLLEYPCASLPTHPVIALPHALAPAQGDIRVACIGAGTFARGVLFPVLKSMSGVQLYSVATSSGTTAVSAAKSFGFRASQSPEDLLNNSASQIVFVLSRNDSHARYIRTALERRKPLFVEKPLVISRDEMQSVIAAHDEQSAAGRAPFLMVGFNRRFAPATDAIRELFANRREPLVMHVRVNAGFLPAEHWTQQSSQGGRIIGEFCHFLDWARFLAGSDIRTIHATAIPDQGRYHRDNFSVTATFADGSIGNFLYLANGDKSVSKEYYEVFSGGSVARLTDFRNLELTSNGKTRRIDCRGDKGHKRELELTFSALRSFGPAPIPFEQIIEVTEGTFCVEDSINTGLPVTVNPRKLIESSESPSASQAS